jgi:hypothetical protein
LGIGATSRGVVAILLIPLLIERPHRFDLDQPAPCSSARSTVQRFYRRMSSRANESAARPSPRSAGRVQDADTEDAGDPNASISLSFRRMRRRIEVQELDPLWFAADQHEH